jgi:hypothetical protein
MFRMESGNNVISAVSFPMTYEKTKAQRKNKVTDEMFSDRI